MSTSSSVTVNLGYEPKALVLIAYKTDGDILAWAGYYDAIEYPNKWTKISAQKNTIDISSSQVNGLAQISNNGFSIGKSTAAGTVFYMVVN